MNERNGTPAAAPSDKIRAAAEEVFAQHGFAGARVDEIARRAGVNKAMLYYHVGDKAVLYGRVLSGYFDELGTRLAEAVASSPEPGEQLSRLHAAFTATAVAHPHFPQIMLREIAAGATNLPREALQGMARFIATTRAVVEEGRNRGDFRSDVDPLTTHILVVASVVFAANGRRLLDRFAEVGAETPETDLDLTDIARSATDIILNGITLKGA